MKASVLEIYLSASISNAPNNAFLASHFDNELFKVYLPQDIVPDQLNHISFPQHVYQQCVDMMLASDLGLVLFDAFGRDCAWECGWYAGRSDKPLFGFVESGSLFLRDWMVKGGLDGLLTTNPRLHAVCVNNPILQHKPVILVPHLQALPDALQQAFFDWKALHTAPKTQK